jgi:hypothetical protein
MTAGKIDALLNGLAAKRDRLDVAAGEITKE